MTKKGTQLLRAVAAGRADLVEAALRRGAPPDARDASGASPLIVALRGGMLEAGRLLIAAGASPNTPDGAGVRPLIVAIRSRNPEAVRLLVDAGVDVEPHVRYHCDLPIIVAAQCGEPTIFEMLLARGANPGPFDGGRFDGYVSALRLALVLGHVEVARLLFAHGFDPQASDAGGTTALMTASAYGHLALVDALLDLGVAVDAVDRRGRTAIMYAIAHNLEAEEDEHTSGERHCAIIARLLARGADRTHVDGEGQSVTAWAAKRGDAAILALFEDARPA